MPNSLELTQVLQEWSLETGFILKDLVPMIVEFAMPLGEFLLQTISPNSTRFSISYVICEQCKRQNQPLFLNVSVYQASLCPCCFRWKVFSFVTYNSIYLDEDFSKSRPNNNIVASHELRNLLTKSCEELLLSSQKLNS